MRDPTGELRPQERIGRSLIQHGVHILQAQINTTKHTTVVKQTFPEL